MSIHEDPLTECHGWAYERCGRAAEFVLVEEWDGGNWAVQPLCLEHRRVAIVGRASEIHPAQKWTWWTSAEWAESRLWPTGDSSK